MPARARDPARQGRRRRHGLRAAVLCAACLWHGPLYALPLDMMIEDRLAAYLDASRALEPGLELKLEFLSPPPPEAEALEDFRFNPATGDFVARLRLPDGGNQTLQGRAILGIETWVPSRRIEPGEIISDADLIPVMLPPGLMNSSMLRDPGDLIGKEVRRPLMANRPVQDRAVMAPRAVVKGARVEIRFSSGALHLTAPGKALADGALGEIIRVVNSSSNTIVTGEVTAPGVVEVK